MELPTDPHLMPFLPSRFPRLWRAFGWLLPVAVIGCSSLAYAGESNTVGLICSTPSASPGYTLFCSFVAPSPYLVDINGQVVHTWQSKYSTSFTGYLKENGDLIKLSQVWYPGLGRPGGVLEHLDWDGNLLWEFNHAEVDFLAHHDIALLPSGNLLMIVYEEKSNAEAVAAGRNPFFTTEIWPEMIVEIEPSGSNAWSVVWEWHVWDHLIQDFDSNQANFGVVTDHPELIDINFRALVTDRDWLHCNSIDYHEAFDQIILSVRNFAEFWVIDHSTTTAEASGNSGGNSGKGGDLLYRWGNPEAYGRGTAADREFWGQHDAQWIPAGSPGSGNILVYNNGLNRPGASYSTAEEIVPPVDTNGFYTNPPAGMAFGPATQTWVYTSTPTGSLYSTVISGVDRQPNGNTLICEGTSGNFEEVAMNGDLAWRYINPVNSAGPITQGALPSDNWAFRVDRYPPDYPAFAGRNLIPNGTLELDSAAVFAIQQAGRTASEVLLTWVSLPDATYHVRHALSLENPVWITISTNVAIGTLTHFTDTDPVRINQSPSFYQAIEGP